MKLLILHMCITFVSVVICDVPNKNCCPADKSTWCKDKEIKKCYTCTFEDEQAEMKQNDQFNKFMNYLDEYDKLKTTWFSTECINNSDVIPVQVQTKINKTNYKNVLYGAYYLNLTKCNNCAIYKTPKLYFECIEPIRKDMIKNITDTIKKTSQELDNSVKLIKCNL